MMRKFLMWFLLLNKRLYKKTTFIIILALIPIVIFALGAVAKEESGVISIAIASEGENETLYNDIVDDLTTKSSLINFIEYDSYADAYNAALTGKVDIAWIFRQNLEDEIISFSQSLDEKDAVVNVVIRENNVITHLTLEKLSSVLYKYVSRNFYINYINEKLPELNDLTDSELLEYYDNFELKGTLFEFDNPSGNTIKKQSNSNYMTTPIRGLLAIIAVICGFAAAMFYSEDEKKGTFSWVKQRNKIFVQFGCVVIAVLNVSLVILISLFLSGVNVTIMRELLSTMVFVLCCSAFCVVVSQLCGRVHVLGCFIPIITVIMFVICPVFFDFGGFRRYQFIFPPTYYISSAYNNKYYLYSVIYFVICFALMIFINKIKQQKKLI